MDDLRFLDPEALVNRAAFNERFGLLNAAALYKTVTPTAQLGTLTEGSIIYLNENGQPVPFYVAKQEYEPDYNTNRVLVVRKDVYTSGQLYNYSINSYAEYSITKWLNNQYKSYLDADVQSAIESTKIIYTPGNGNTSVGVLETGVFLLSLTELGKSDSNANVEGTKLPISEILETVTQSGLPSNQWTRTPVKNTTTDGYIVRQDKGLEKITVTAYSGIRPIFTLPSTFSVALAPTPTTGLYDLSNNLLLTLPGVQIETGSYVGTGTYGSSNPNSLTFGFVPILVFLTEINTLNIDGESPGLRAMFTVPSLSNNFSTGGYEVFNSTYGDNSYSAKVNGTTLSWYSSQDATEQFNRVVGGTPFRYDYVAIS